MTDLKELWAYLVCVIKVMSLSQRPSGNLNGKRGFSEPTLFYRVPRLICILSLFLYFNVLRLLNTNICSLITKHIFLERVLFSLVVYRNLVLIRIDSNSLAVKTCQPLLIFVDRIMDTCEIPWWLIRSLVEQELASTTWNTHTCLYALIGL